MARAKKPSTPGDMIRSLVIIVMPLLLISFFFTRNPKDHPVTVVNWQPVLAEARAQAPYPVLAPTHLPQDWRATVVTWVRQGDPYLNGEPAVRNTWQLGFLAPDNTYIGLEQGDKQVTEFVSDESRAGRPDGDSVVNGQRWQRLVTDDDRTRSLVKSTARVTTIVTGDTSYPELESYTATLSAG